MNDDGRIERPWNGDGGHVNYEFGGYCLDSAQRLLFRHGKPLHLPPKSLELLAYFVSNPNRVIDKETLLREVWSGTFVEEANLSVHISNLRKLLSQDARKDVSIETFPKLGYRFNANVAITDGSVVSGEQGVGALTSVTTKGPGRWLYFGLSIVAVVIAVSAFTIYRNLSREETSEQTITAPSGFEQTGPYALSPNGEYVANSSTKDGTYTLVLTHLPSNNRIPLTEPGKEVFLGIKFARDGNSLFYVRQLGETTALYRVPFLGGPPTRILDDVGWDVTLGPDNERIAFVRTVGKGETALTIARIDGAGTEVLATRAGSESFGDSLAWSPNGRIVAAIVGGRIVGVDVNTHEETPLSEVFTTGIGDGLVWLPDGSGLLAVGGEKNGGNGGIWHVAFPSGKVDRVTNDLNNYGRIDISADGKTIVSAKYEDISRLWISDKSSDSYAPVVTSHKHGFNWIRWGPSNRIVFGSSASGQRDVWMMNSDGTEERQITNTGGIAMPIVSPDGQYVVFSSNRGEQGRSNLWRTSLDGTDFHRLTDGPGENQPAITPDGQWVYYTSSEIDSPPEQRSLWRVSINGTGAEQVLDVPAYGADIAPDGGSFACWFKSPGSQWKIAVFPINGKKPLKLFDAPQGQPVNWTADGKAIAYVKVEKGVSNVWTQPIAGGPPKQVTEFTSARILQFDWSKDNQIACSRTERRSELVFIKNFH